MKWGNYITKRFNETCPDKEIISLNDPENKLQKLYRKTFYTIPNEKIILQNHRKLNSEIMSPTLHRICN